MSPHELTFTHKYVPSSGDVRTLLLLHGTGGDENDLLPLGKQLAPRAALLSPRGKVLEHGMPRFFRRLAEGVFDIDDLIARTAELADFVAAASAHYGFDADHVIAVGFSNGANIAASLLLLRPATLAGAILLRPMVPLQPSTPPTLAGKRVLICSGTADPIVPRGQPATLADMLQTAGAAVQSVAIPGGHGLTQADIQAAMQWMHSV
jgi:phospholipase/carboxylesterase